MVMERAPELTMQDRPDQIVLDFQDTAFDTGANALSLL